MGKNTTNKQILDAYGQSYNMMQESKRHDDLMSSLEKKTTTKANNKSQMKTLITTQSNFTHYGRTIRTCHRNSVFMLHFLEAYCLTELGGEYDFQRLNDFVTQYSNHEKIDEFLNKLPIEFGRYILDLSSKSPRTLEHSIEDIFKHFLESILVAPDEHQVDYNDEKVKEYRQFGIDNELIHAPNGCPL